MNAKSSRSAIEWGLAAAILVASHTAHADERDGEAQRLFDEARVLMDEGAVAEACTKLEASLGYNPANGTRLNLAVCREREGKFAAATVLFTEVVREAQRAGQSDKVAVAMRHLDAIGPLVPTLEVRVPRAARDTGVRLYIDGDNREAVLRGGILLTETGRHHLELVSEDGRRGVADVTLEPGARSIVNLDLPPRATPVGPPPVVTAPTRPHHLPTPPPPPAEETSRWPVAFGVALGFGVAATAVGAGFGVSAAGLDADADAACPASLGGGCRTEEAAADAEAAGDAAIAANVLIGAGVVLVAASVIALVVAPWDDGAGAKAPRATARGVALSF